jgi:bacterioferritin-associated ferredoxin
MAFTAMTSLESITVETEDCVGTCRSCPSVGSCGDRLVCRCLKITEHAIVTSIRTIGLSTIDEVKAATGAGGGCTCCHRELRQYLAVYSPSSPNMCSAR